MRRFQLLPIGILVALLPVLVMAAEAESPRRPLEGLEYESAPEPPEGGVGATAAPQSDSAQEASAPAAVGAPTPQKHPHLIELTSKNWRPLSGKEKFGLFWRDLADWQTHVSLAIDAAIAFGTDDRDYLGAGARGYFKRYGLNVIDEANGTFVQAFMLPALFHEDPRYIPLEAGSTRRRAGYAASRVLITRSDSGASRLNKSKLIGTFVSSALSNTYATGPDRNNGFDATITRGLINLGSDAAFDLFKEFWPDVARKIRLNVWIRNVVRSSIRDAIRVD
jgi:hypothetical protein